MTKFDNPTSQLDASAGVVKHKATLSIVLPARNEAGGLDLLLPKLVALYPDAQIIVINDGSTDDTLAVCERYGVTTATHVYSMGNGAAIKQGAARSTGEYVVFMDADGQHNPADIAKLVSKLDERLRHGCRCQRWQIASQHREVDWQQFLQRVCKLDG